MKLYPSYYTSLNYKLNGYKVSLNEDNTINTTFRSVIGERVMLRTNSYDNLKTGALGNIISYDNNRITVEFDNGITEMMRQKIEMNIGNNNNYG